MSRILPPDWFLAIWKYDHISPVYMELHLPHVYLIEYKVTIITYKTFNNVSPKGQTLGVGQLKIEEQSRSAKFQESD